MANPSKLYFSDDFSPEKAKYYTLLLQIRPTDFSFAVVFQDALLAWGKYYPLAELADPKEIGEFLLHQYRKVVLAIAPEVFTIVPTALYKDDLMINYARFLDVEPGEKVYKEALDDENIVFYKDGDALISILTRRYKYHRITFYHKGLIKAISDTEPTLQNLYLDIQHQRVNILYFKGNKLRFINGYNYVTDNELVYFTGLVTNELHLHQNNLRLIISGDITVSDKGIATLAEYFSRVEINKQQPLEKLPADIEPHQVLSITALLLCE